MVAKTYFTINELKSFDNWAIETVGIPSLILMENAGRSVAEKIYEVYFHKKRKKQEMVIFCGLGNNGGDGLVLARHLFVKGVKVKAYIVGGVSGLLSDSELNFRILRKLGIQVFPLLSEKDVMKVKLNPKHILVDAILGVGINREVTGIQREVIEYINDSKCQVVSLDIPSGFNSNTGGYWGTCIKADKTITFSYKKKGFMQKSSKALTGEVSVVNIGIIK